MRSLIPRRLDLVLETLGVLMLIGAAVFWAWTERQSLLLMMSAVTLVAVGAFQGAQQQLPSVPGESR